MRKKRERVAQVNNEYLDVKSTDAMTGVYTKEYFFKYAQSIIKDNPDVDFCIVELDVNKLTMINEMYGLNEGDRLLKRMSSIIKGVLEEERFTAIARIHADLFAFLCPYSEKVEKNYIEDIEKAVADFGVSLNFELLISFGVYHIDDRDLEVSKMCERANLALKSVKGNYINHVGHFDKEMREKAVLEIDITSKMNKALKNGDFKVYFQPKHSLDDESVIGAEALVRWIAHGKTIYNPDQFIPIFEENGFIMKLDTYVWEETCRFISILKAQGKIVPPISVNISRVDLYNPDLVETLVGFTKKYAIDPKMLRLEFTESAYAQSEQLMLKTMEKFHAYGMNVEMDDFGSGYSSLNMLKDVPIDGLKIDLRFLSATHNETKSNRILAAVLHMAKWLGIPSIVEGVETKEQINHLKNLGCTTVQGFYYSRPMPQNEFVDYLDEKSVTEEGYKENFIYESVIDPDSWWNNIVSDCEPLLEMHGAYILADKGEDNELEIILASDSYYELTETTRSALYDECLNAVGYVHKDDVDGLCRMFDEVHNYHTMGQYIYRRKFKDGYKWMFIKARLLEKNDKHGVYFCVLDDVSDLMNKMKEGNIL